MLMKQPETESVVDRVDAISTMIGNTPLLKVNYRFDGHPRSIFAKYESENMTGSVKDRMAVFTIRSAYLKGTLKPGDTIVEASSGNTGISFAALGAALGHPVRIYMPDWMSHERIELIKTFGATVELVSHQQGGFVGSVNKAEAFARAHDHVFLPRQFDNDDNITAHQESTGPELERQLAMFDVEADAFVAGVGTGGSVMGIGRYLSSSGRSVKVHPLEPANSPTLRRGCCVGHHRIQGISDEFIPTIVHLDELDEIVDCWDGDAILMAQRLCGELGLAVGISSGANVLGAITVNEWLGGHSTVATLLPDSNKKYLSTDLFHTEPVLPKYLTPRVELVQFSAVR